MSWDWTAPVSIDPLLKLIKDPEKSIFDFLNDNSIFKLAKDKNSDMTK